MKVTKANALNASHLSPTLRAEKIMTFGSADCASEHHAAGPAVLNSGRVHNAGRHRARPHSQDPVPTALGSDMPGASSKVMIFSPRSVEIKWLAFEVVCFGDFHLDQQMKVTRPPGRIPGMGLTQVNPSAKRHQMKVTRPPGRIPGIGLTPVNPAAKRHQMKAIRPSGRDPAQPHAVNQQIERTTQRSRPPGRDPEATHAV